MFIFDMFNIDLKVSLNIQIPIWTPNPKLETTKQKNSSLLRQYRFTNSLKRIFNHLSQHLIEMNQFTRNVFKIV